MKSIAKSSIENDVLGKAEPVLSTQGFRIVDVDCRVGPRSLVRLYIERLKAEAGAQVTLGDCAEASRSLETVFDENFLAGSYDLEVSSPGLDRRLRLQPDFEAVVGDEVKLAFTASIEGFGSKTRGRLLKVEQDGVVVLVPGKPEHKFLFDQIKQANRIYEFK